MAVFGDFSSLGAFPL